MIFKKNIFSKPNQNGGHKQPLAGARLTAPGSDSTNFKQNEDDGKPRNGDGSNSIWCLTSFSQHQAGDEKKKHEKKFFFNA